MRIHYRNDDWWMVYHFHDLTVMFVTRSSFNCDECHLTAFRWVGGTAGCWSSDTLRLKWQHQGKCWQWTSRHLIWILHSPSCIICILYHLLCTGLFVCLQLENPDSEVLSPVKQVIEFLYVFILIWLMSFHIFYIFVICLMLSMIPVIMYLNNYT